MVWEQVRWFFQALGKAVFPAVRACLGAVYLAEEGGDRVVPAPRRPDESELGGGASGPVQASGSTVPDLTGPGPGPSMD